MEGFMKILMVIALLLLLCGSSGWTVNNADPSLLSASAIVIRCVKPGEDPKGTTMWVMLGEPLTSIAVPLWAAAGAPPPELWDGKDSALSKESARLKNVLRPLKTAERRDYVDVTRRDNAAGTGWLATPPPWRPSGKPCSRSRNYSRETPRRRSWLPLKRPRHLARWPCCRRSPWRPQALRRETLNKKA
jgi:hypothetical protein